MADATRNLHDAMRLEQKSVCAALWGLVLVCYVSYVQRFTRGRPAVPFRAYMQDIERVDLSVPDALAVFFNAVIVSLSDRQFGTRKPLDTLNEFLYKITDTLARVPTEYQPIQGVYASPSDNVPKALLFPRTNTQGSPTTFYLMINNVGKAANVTAISRAARLPGVLVFARVFIAAAMRVFESGDVFEQPVIVRSGLVQQTIFPSSRMEEPPRVRAPVSGAATYIPFVVPYVDVLNSQMRISCVDGLMRTATATWPTRRGMLLSLYETLTFLYAQSPGDERGPLPPNLSWASDAAVGPSSDMRRVGFRTDFFTTHRMWLERQLAQYRISPDTATRACMTRWSLAAYVRFLLTRGAHIQNTLLPMAFREMTNLPRLGCTSFVLDGARAPGDATGVLLLFMHVFHVLCVDVGAT